MRTRRPSLLPVLGLLALLGADAPPARAAYSGFSDGDAICNRIRREPRRTQCHCRTRFGASAWSVGRSVRIRGATSHRMVPLVWACVTGWKPGAPVPLP